MSHPTDYQKAAVADELIIGKRAHETQETSPIVPISEIYKLQDEPREAQNVKVPYRENQLDMAHATINQLRYHIARALERLDMIEGGVYPIEEGDNG